MLVMASMLATLGGLLLLTMAADDAPMSVDLGVDQGLHSIAWYGCGSQQ